MATCRSPTCSTSLFVNGWKSTGRDRPSSKVVKFPLAPGDYSAQAAQIGDADCLFGNIGEINWPPLITALERSRGQPARFYGPQGNLDAKVAEELPGRDRGRHRS